MAAGVEDRSHGGGSTNLLVTPGPMGPDVLTVGPRLKAADSRVKSGRGASDTQTRDCVLFAIAEQRREPLFAVAAEIDHAAAGSGVARGPFQLGEARHQRRAQRAGEMMPPLAPVEAGLAHRAGADVRASRAISAGCVRQETLALGGEFDRLFFGAPVFALHAVEHLHAEIAGKMIVADPGAAQRRVLRPGAHAHMAGARRKSASPSSTPATSGSVRR